MIRFDVFRKPQLFRGLLRTSETTTTLASSAQAESARTNVFEDVSAAQGAHQVVASATDMISAKRVTAAAGSTQWLGQCSNGTLQQFSRDRSRVAVKEAVKESCGRSCKGSCRVAGCDG